MEPSDNSHIPVNQVVNHTINNNKKNSLISAEAARQGLDIHRIPMGLAMLDHNVLKAAFGVEYDETKAGGGEQWRQGFWKRYGKVKPTSDDPTVRYYPIPSNFPPPFSSNFAHLIPPPRQSGAGDVVSSWINSESDISELDSLVSIPHILTHRIFFKNGAEIVSTPQIVDRQVFGRRSATLNDFLKQGEGKIFTMFSKDLPVF
ncbi:hypothetical protein CPB83DRAFT_837308 [Crepidotus variabilis]|uniref:Uncharacterized protein n=1 Tax=Crepidotus variabilis TaxID=179855 RepID=A0A9P6ECT5_9AGAR|nr:hypothetical protein CPB83DRAFT_837308 [Crepidotus variabilis]